MFDPTNRRHVRNRQKIAKQIDSDNTIIVKSIMSDYAGRRWFHDRFQRSRIFSSPFSSDPLQMAFNCGEQNLALQEFLQVVSLCPDEYIQMMREANERHHADDIASRVGTGIDAEREAGNRAEAERVGILAKRRDAGVQTDYDAFGDEDTGDEDGAEGR